MRALARRGNARPRGVRARRSSSIAAIETLALEPTVRRHDELMAKGDLTDDERAELKELNVAIHWRRARATPMPRAASRRVDKFFDGVTLLARILRSFQRSKHERKSLTRWRFSLCQATVICVECAPFPASHLDRAVGIPTVSYLNTPWASDTHDSKAQAPHCSCLEKARQESGQAGCCRPFFERKGQSRARATHSKDAHAKDKANMSK